MPYNISWKDIVRDVVSGMSDTQLRAKYGVSARQLEMIYQRLSQIRRRRIGAIVGDIAEGNDPSQLIEKYGLSPIAMGRVLNQVLRGALKRLIREGGTNRAGLLPTGREENTRPKFLQSRNYHRSP